MGLDITAYSQLRHVGKHVEGWCDDYEHHVQAYAYDVFPQSFRGIPIVSTKTQEGFMGGSFIEGGCFEITDETKTHSFRAGSYGGYNRWRADLQQQFNPDRDPDGPFYELIWFADNEGSIGPDAAKDLLADFREHADSYKSGDEPFDWHRHAYEDWTRACELAADGGLIHFH
jgi:hypothetical protein